MAKTLLTDSELEVFERNTLSIISLKISLKVENLFYMIDFKAWMSSMH